MFCPNCGKGDQSANAFCRDCGEWMVDMSGLTRGGFVKQTPEQRLLATFILSVLSGIFAYVAAALLIYSLAGVKGTFAIVMAMSLALVIGSFGIVNSITTFELRREILRRKRKDLSARQLSEIHTTNHALPPADTSRLIRPNASVTENTTDLLEPVLRQQQNS